MRGEHSRCWCCPHRAWGSSPHARGTLNMDKTNFRGRGIIPACAGNTCATVCVRLGYGDHPRMRGEHILSSFFIFGVSGSSPHARGTLHIVSVAQDRRGIIPACAGNTHCCKTSRSRAWDHPRMRGEHPYRIIPIPEDLGSSPHARGTLIGGLRVRKPLGIIPACAGNTYPFGIIGDHGTGIIPACAGNTKSWPPRSARNGDHPRMRGEHESIEDLFD